MNETKRPLKVFLCHASIDKPKVRELYRYLRRRGVNPWFDEEHLVGGQDWQVEIPKALATSDAIIICLTKNSVDKEGYIQKEIKFALDKALEMPEGRIFLIPIKFEECEVPFSLSRYQWVDLTIEAGYSKMMKALKFRASQLERTTVELPKKAVEEENLALEKAAREKEEKGAIEKAKLEADELENQESKNKTFTSEPIVTVFDFSGDVPDSAQPIPDFLLPKARGSEAVEKISEKKAKQESTEKPKPKAVNPKPVEERPLKKTAQANQKEIEIQSLQHKSSSQIIFWVVGLIVVIFVIGMMSSLNNKTTPQVLVPTSFLVSTTTVLSTTTVSTPSVTKIKTLVSSPMPTETNALLTTSLEVINSNNLENLVELYRSKYDNVLIYDVFWAPDSKAFAARNFYNHAFSYFSLVGNKEILPITPGIEILGFSKDGNLVGYENVGKGEIKFWKNLPFDTEPQILSGHTQDVSVAILSPDGEFLITGSADNTIRVWRVSDGTLISTLVGHDNDVGGLAISSNKKIIASSANDYTIRLWDVATEHQLFKLDVQGLYAPPIAFSPDGNLLASYINYTTLALWNVSDGSLIKTLDCKESVNTTRDSNDISFSPDSQFLVINSCNSKITIWSVFNDVAPTDLGSSKSWFDKVDFLVDSKVLVQSFGPTIFFNDLNNGSILYTIDVGSPDYLSALDISPDGRVLLGIDKMNIYLWGIPK